MTESDDKRPPEDSENSPQPGEESVTKDDSGAQESSAAPPSEGGPEEQPSSDESIAESATDTSNFEDELPEDEELTPEIVEEEAIRGDFMLRWATILMAVLFGFSLISDSRTLVHIRSGESLSANGFLPASSDTLSYAMEGRSAANVSWLFDLIVSQVYGAGGETGLTLFKALIAGIIAWVLSHISVPGMPTWWSSICGAFAMVACSVDFMPVTDLMMLLGLVCTIRLLHTFDDGDANGLMIKLPVLIAIWCNLDARAYLGVVAIVLFAAGAKIRQSQAVRAGDTPGSDVGMLWKAAALSFAALLINPSPIASALSVVTSYSVEYPTMRMMKPIANEIGEATPSASILDGRTEYSSLWSPGVLEGFEFAYFGGLTLLVIAFAVVIIARSRENLPWFVTLLGFTLLGLLTLHDLSAAALVAAVTAGVVAQRWYGRTFRQEYTVDTMEVLFSRGGRAATVLGFAVLAFVVVADRVPTRSALGIGFDSDLKTTITSLEKELAVVPDDARILNTTMTQGDLLIWHGRQSFVDSRAAFGRPANSGSTIARFDSLRRSLLMSNENPSETSEDAANEIADPRRNPQWRDEYNELGISRVMLRLAPPGPPAYSVVRAFARSPEWMLTSRGTSAVFFARSEDNAKADEKFDLRRLAFQEEAEEFVDTSRPDYARAPNFYEEHVYAKRSVLDETFRAAQNIYSLDSQIPHQNLAALANAFAQDPENEQLVQTVGQILAGPYLIIRGTQKTLFKDPQNAAAFQLQGRAYQELRRIENMILQVVGGQNIDDIRYMQALIAFRQAATIDPSLAGVWNSLVSLYQEKGKTDLALECLEHYLSLVEDDLLEGGEEAGQQLRQMDEARFGWAERKASMETALEESLGGLNEIEDPQQRVAQKVRLIQDLYNQGAVRTALTFLNDNLDEVRAIPAAEVLRGKMLLETGDLTEAADVLGKFASYARQSVGNPEIARLDWQSTVALVELARGDYVTARATFSEKLSNMRMAEREMGRLDQPIARELAMVVPDRPAPMGWPANLLYTSQTVVGAVQKSKAGPLFLGALLDIESGSLKEAKTALTKLLEECGEATVRPQAIIYLAQLSDTGLTTAKGSLPDLWEDFEIAGLTKLEDGSTAPGGVKLKGADPDELSANKDQKDEAPTQGKAPSQTELDASKQGAADTAPAAGSEGGETSSTEESESKESAADSKSNEEAAATAESAEGS